jgi:hypothetical protein
MVSLQRYEEADRALEALQALAPGDSRGSMRFVADLPKPAVELPKVKLQWPKKASFFASADAFYLEIFAPALIRSLAAAGCEAPLHIHFLGEGMAPIEQLKRIGYPITCTLEDPSRFIQKRGMDPRSYYNAIRLIRFAEAVEASQEPLILLDIDCLATKNPQHLLHMPGEIALRLRAARWEPWNQFSACFVRGTPPAKSYFRKVADIVRGSIATPWWGLDQYALFSAYLRQKPDVTCVGPDVADVEGTDGIFCYIAGKRKNTLATDQTPYAILHRQFGGGLPRVS